MGKRSRFTRIRDQVISLFNNIRECIQQLWTTIQDLCTSEDSPNRNDACGGFVLLSDIYSVRKEDQCTNCEETLKVSMACQTDPHSFNNALKALGKYFDDCYVGSALGQGINNALSKSPNAKSSLERSVQQQQAIFSNFNENYSAKRNRKELAAPSSAPVQITQSPLPIVRETPGPTQSAGSRNNLSEFREDDMVNQQHRNKHVFNNYTKNMRRSSISKTIYHIGKRSIGTSAFVLSADASTQTFLSINPTAIYLPIPTPPSIDNGKVRSGNSIDSGENASKKNFQNDKTTSTGENFQSDSIFHFTGVQTPETPLKSVENVTTKTSANQNKQQKQLSTNSTISVNSGTIVSDTVTATHKRGKKDVMPAQPNQQKLVSESNETKQKLSESKASMKPQVTEENTTISTEAKLSLSVEVKAVPPHGKDSPKKTMIESRADGRTENASVYRRENYIKVMLLKIVEKIPHIKKMKKRQDSLPEGDPERERLHKTINTEIKKNINHGIKKFYTRYNKLRPSERTNTTQLEKDFLMDLISEMKRKDTEFLADEMKSPTEKYIRRENEDEHEFVESKVREDETRRLQQLQEAKRQARDIAQKAVSDGNTGHTLTDVEAKPQHHNEHLHRTDMVTKSALPLPDNSKASDQRSEGKADQLACLDKDCVPEARSVFVKEKARFDARTNEGAIINLMNDLEDEAHRDGLFTNWDATPFGDIAQVFDRGHYRIDGQAMVSKGSRGSKVDARPQKVKRRGIPNKHLQNTSTYLVESAADTQKDWLLGEDVSDVSSDDAALESTDNSSDFNIAHETLISLDNTEIEANSPANEEPVVDTRHLQDMPCDVIMKKKGECDLLEEKYSVSKPSKNKTKPKKKKSKKSTIYAVNYSNNADDEWSDDDDDDDSDSDSGDEISQSSDDETNTDSECSEAVNQARIDRYTEMLQKIHYNP